MGLISVEAICAGVAFLVYINTFTADFVYDDSRAVLKNLDVQTTTPVQNIFYNDFWGTSMSHSGSHKSYRPITILTFRLNYVISGLQPWSYHVTNVILHSITTWLFVVFLKSEIFIGTVSAQLKSAAVGLLFAVHPIHTEAVAGVVGRADVLSTLFVLACILSYAKYCSCDDGKLVISGKSSKFNEAKKKHKKRKEKIKIENQKYFKNVEKHHYFGKIMNELHYAKNIVSNNLSFVTSPALAVAFAACAIFSKENGFCALPLCAIYDVWIRNKLGISTMYRMLFHKNPDIFHQKVRRRIFFLTTSTLSLLCLRIFPWTILSTHNTTPTFSTADNPASTSDSVIARTLTFLHLPVINFFLLLCPTSLSYDWGDIPMVESIWDCRNMSTITFYFGLCIFAKDIWKNLRTNDDYWKIHENSTFVTNCVEKVNTANTISQITLHENTNELFKALMKKRKSNEDCTIDEGVEKGPRSNTERVDRTKILGESESSVVFRKLSTHVRSDISSKRLLMSEKSTGSGCLSCHLPESTNSSGYATESGEEGFEETIDNCQNQIKALTKTEKSPNTLHVETLYSHKKQYHHSKPLQAIGRSEILLISFAMMIIPFLPATNIFFYVGFVIAERFLYLPSIGFCILVTEGGFMLYHKISLYLSNARSRKRWKFVASMIALLYLLVLSARTFTRNQDWSNELNLYRSGILTSPAKSWANLGNVLKVKGRIKEAELSYINALKVRGNMADVHYNLGLLYQEQRRYTEALDKYKEAIQYRPTLAVAHLNTGIILAELGKFEEAEKVYRHTAEIDDTGLRDPNGHQKTKVSALYNLGCMFASQGKHDEALPVFLLAVKRRTNNYEPHSLFNMLGQSYFKLDRIFEAEYWFKESLSSKGDHVPAHLTYASLLAKTGRTEEAEKLYRNAILIEPENHVVYTHFGKFFADLELYHKAAAIMSDAVMTKSGSLNYDTVTSSAEYHRLIKKYAKSETYYRMATKIKPKAVSSHVNLGAILHLQKKYDEARRSYKRALSLQPDDPTALKNLQKLNEAIDDEGLL